MTIEFSETFYVKNKDTYPPFKDGLYLEEYFSKYLKENPQELEREYIDCHWTNFQIEDWFNGKKWAMQREFNFKVPIDRLYFTVVQYDDGPLLELPPYTMIFGACSGHVPIPLIYEDKNNTLINIRKKTFKEKQHLCSFVGSLTHNVRHNMLNHLGNLSGYVFHINGWTASVPKNNSDMFIKVTTNSKFCLAPRGYGRGSFRFYEAFQLNSIPVYIWDDIEWLPYKEFLDYSKFCISIHVSQIHELPDILESINEEKYNEMQEEYKKVKEWFTLKGMSEYIVQKLKKGT